jgi:hypothetical protein
MRRIAILATLTALLLGGAAAGDTVCRPNALGNETCIGPAVRPEPRRRIRSDVQALERVIVRPEAGRPETRFVPSARRNRLGTTIFQAPGPPGACVADSLGNLRCR